MSATKVIQVKGVDPYDITIGRALLGEVGKALGSGVKKVLVIHPVGLTASAELLKSTLDDQGYEAILAGVPDSREALEQGLLDRIQHREGRQVADRFDQIQEFQIGLRVMGSHLHVAKYVVSTLLKSRELWRGNGLNYRP